MDSKDMTMFFNVAPVRAKLIPKLKEERPKMIADMKAKIEENEARRSTSAGRGVQRTAGWTWPSSSSMRRTPRPYGVAATRRHQHDRPGGI
jgi:hypothetical protein